MSPSIKPRPSCSVPWGTQVDEGAGAASGRAAPGARAACRHRRGVLQPLRNSSASCVARASSPPTQRIDGRYTLATRDVAHSAVGRGIVSMWTDESGLLAELTDPQHDVNAANSWRTGRPHPRGRDTVVPPADREALESTRRNPRGELLAGLTVAIVALPSPWRSASRRASEHAPGSRRCCRWDRGRHLRRIGRIQGPTGAMTVVLRPVVQHHGTAGADGRRHGRTPAHHHGHGAPGPICALSPGLGGRGLHGWFAVVVALQQVPAALGVSHRPATRCGRQPLTP